MKTYTVIAYDHITLIEFNRVEEKLPDCLPIEKYIKDLNVHLKNVKSPWRVKELNQNNQLARNAG